MEMENEPILCFQHCEKGTNITCLRVPEVCPLCHRQIEFTPMEIPPFRIPSPFISCRDKPCSLLIKPTMGSFLNDYKSSTDLHVGVTDSKGYVYNYNETGVHRDITGWSECIAVQLVKSTRDSSFTYTWDAKLHEFTLQADWGADRYIGDHHNCYDFVLGFLQHMGLHEQYPSILNRSQFCHQMVLPSTTQAAKYIALYRKLLTQETSVQQGHISTAL